MFGLRLVSRTCGGGSTHSLRRLRKCSSWTHKAHEQACLVHGHRKFVEAFERTGSEIAKGAIERIAKLYAVEKMAKGKPADTRAALRTEHTKPIFDDLEVWLAAQLPKISGTTKLAEAIRYAVGRLPKARGDLSDGHLEPDNNICERSIRPVALGRKNYIFMGSFGSGKAAAIAYTRSRRCARR